MSGDTDRVPRRDIWAEVAFNLTVRIGWAGFFVVSGAFIGDTWDEPGVVALFGLGAVCVLGLALLFEYRRAAWRLRREQLQARIRSRQGAREAVFQFDGKIPTDQWIYDHKAGVRFKLLPDLEVEATESKEAA